MLSARLPLLVEASCCGARQRGGFSKKCQLSRLYRKSRVVQLLPIARPFEGARRYKQRMEAELVEEHVGEFTCLMQKATLQTASMKHLKSWPNRIQVQWAMLEPAKKCNNDAFRRRIKMMPFEKG
jgi:hypothetical protein